MRAKISIAAVTVLAFVLGTMASGIYTATSRAFNPVDEKVNSPAETVKSTAQTHFVQPKTVYVSEIQQISGLRVADWYEKSFHGSIRNSRPEI